MDGILLDASRAHRHRARRPRSRVLALALFVALAGSCGPPARTDAATAVPLEPPPGQPGETGIGVWLGGGWYSNSQFNGELEANNLETIDGGFEYGVVVRHRLSRWVSLGLDLMRLEGQSTRDDGTEFSILGSPLVINGFVHPMAPGGVDVALFAGAGVLMGGTIRSSTPSGSLEAKTLGYYVHAGGEAEARIGPNLAFTLRALFRNAKASNIDFRAVTGDPTALFNVDFNGAAIHFGPRWYFGGKVPAPPPAQSK